MVTQAVNRSWSVREWKISSTDTASQRGDKPRMSRETLLCISPRPLSMLATLVVAAAVGAGHAESEQVSTVTDVVVETTTRVMERGRDQDEGPARSKSQFPEDPTIYVPIPLPEVTEYEEAKAMWEESSRVVSYDIATGEKTVSEIGQKLLPSSSRTGGMTGRAPRLLEAEETAVNEGQPQPLNFSDLQLVTNPEDYPWSVNCKLYMTFPGPAYYVASGVLIDATHVLTAGHCVHEGGGGSWASDIVVVPAYENGWKPYGDASAVQLHSWNGWTVSGDFNYDMGVIDLDRPVGALTRWHGYGYNNDCSFFTGNTFHNPGYPAESPYNGEFMYYWYGPFDSCPWFTDLLQIDRIVYRGQSGSGAYHIDGSNRYVYAVASHRDAGATWGRYCKLTSSRFTDIRDNIIAADTPSTFDLIPLDVATSPETIVAGEQLSSMSYVVHNYSSASWSGTVYVDVYLSTNDNISTSDTLLQTRSFTYNFGPKSTATVTATSSLPTIPSPTVTGDYWIGIILAVTDYNTGNNDSDGQEASPIHVTCQVPPAPTNVQASDETYCDRVHVTWNSSTGADEYRVYRDGSSLSSWQSGTSYDDYSANPGTVYTYQVRARNSCGESELGTGNYGYRKAAPPTPTGVAASDGSHCDMVLVAWNWHSEAEEHQVYRNGSTLTPWMVGVTSYGDYSADTGVVYTYQVRARNSCGESALSSGNNGYRSTPPAAPTDVQASDGAYYDRVYVTWNSCSGADEYRVYRDGSPLSSWQSATSYNDYAAIPAQTYSYAVAARNECGESVLGATDAGYVALPSTISYDPMLLIPSCLQGQNASSQTFEVWNSGGGTLNYTLSEEVSWISSISPSSGSSTGGHNTHTVNYSTSGLSPDTYETNITIDGPGATNTPQYVHVTLMVEEGYVGGIHYVSDMHGDDISGDGSDTNPWSTITHALAQVSGIEGNAATICVDAGTYPESVTMEQWVDLEGGWRFTPPSTWERAALLPVTDPAYETVIDGSTARGGEPAYHVVVGADNAKLDGFTVTGGEARGIGESQGGGMINDGCSPTVANCVFDGNSSSYRGGGMYNASGSPTVTNCVFIENSGGELGGGMYNYHSSPTMTECQFLGNSAPINYGGAVYNYSSIATIENCTFAYNWSYACGGAIVNYESSATIVNCTFKANETPHGPVGGMANLGNSATAIVTNCIFWANADESGTSEIAQIHNDGDILDINYSCVQNWTGALGGDGNIGDDPLLSGYHLQYGSPCIDTGTDAGVLDDIDGEPRPFGAGHDMGARTSLWIRTVTGFQTGSNEATTVTLTRTILTIPLRIRLVPTSISTIRIPTMMC